MDVQISAGVLVAEGRCSPQCLLAMEDRNGQCRCRCGGIYHGALADIPVLGHENDRHWYSGHGYEPSRLAKVHRKSETDVAEFNRFWRDCKAQEIPAVWVDRGGGQKAFSSRYDTWTASSWPIPPDHEALIDQLVRGLISNYYAEFGGSGESGAVFRLRSETEARIIAAAFDETLHGETAGIRRLLAALSDSRKIRLDDPFISAELSA